MIGQLAAAYPATFGMIPKNMWGYGSGGINGSGALCGNVNASQSILYLMGAPTNVKDQMFRWFEDTAIPTNAAYVDFRNGWMPSDAAISWGAYDDTGTATKLPTPLSNCPKVKPGTVTCHGAHTKWKTVSGSWLTRYGAKASNDRCGKTTYDTAYKLATLINSWMSGATISAPVWDASLSTTSGCEKVGCHTGTGAYPVEGATAKMTCTPCHSQRIGDGHNL